MNKRTSSSKQQELTQEKRKIVNADRHLVLAVNELYHDLEGAAYAMVHPEIFLQESFRWKRLLKKYVQNGDHPITILDIGSGTGFVGEQMMNCLKANDTIICSDVSKTMLSIAQKNLEERYPRVHVKSLKLIDEDLPLEDNSINIITMNSVLHHVPEPQRLLKNIARILAPGGLLFIGHEPNIQFIQKKWLSRQGPIINAIMPWRLAIYALRYLRILPKNQSAKNNDAFYDRINQALLERKLIREPLTRSEISQLVDIHSPTAGGMERKEGFDPRTLLNVVHPSLQTVHIESYNHLGKISGRHKWLLPYEKVLAMLYPRLGATFFLVAKKKEENTR